MSSSDTDTDFSTTSSSQSSETSGFTYSPYTDFEPAPLEKTSYKYTSSLKRRLRLIEEWEACKRALCEERKNKGPFKIKPRKKAKIVSNVTDTVKDEEYILPDPATLERLMMKPSNGKACADNEREEGTRELRRLIRRSELEKAGLMLGPGNDLKVNVYVEFEKSNCRNLNDTHELLYSAWTALIWRSQRREYANPQGEVPQGMVRLGLTVETESTHPEDVYKDAIEATQHLYRTRDYTAMQYPIGYGNVTLNLVHYGLAANGAKPSSVGVGILLHEL
ncbi:uncharacterized protein KD926_005088 [Aspergillus affinis]|uniref:uncharacterized protein n=1 Tax=Aspergillus affinis TaxID=1070780 RepID=UPI0022FDD0E7|nr:uncharacterized protein KD926_005088 [Aspergillus affinis]KAI9042758.1 hypothetical protein KD926_005088 [Aspergillus affinis]